MEDRLSPILPSCKIFRVFKKSKISEDKIYYFNILLITLSMNKTPTTTPPSTKRETIDIIIAATMLPIPNPQNIKVSKNFFFHVFSWYTLSSSPQYIHSSSPHFQFISVSETQLVLLSNFTLICLEFFDTVWFLWRLFKQFIVP